MLTASGAAFRAVAVVGAAVSSVWLVQLLSNTIRFRNLVRGKRKKTQQSQRIPKVASWLPFIGAGVEFEKSPTAFLKKYSKSLGSIFSCHMGGKTFVFVCDPFELSTVLKHPHLKFHPFLTQTSVNALGCHPDDWDPSESQCDKVANIFQKELCGVSLTTVMQKITFLLSDVDRLLAIKALLTVDSKSEGRIEPSHDGTWTTLGRPEYTVDLYEFVWRLMFDVSTYSMMGKCLPECYDDFRVYCQGFRYLFMGLPNFLVKKFSDARARLNSRVATLPFDRFSDVLKVLIQHNQQLGIRNAKFFGAIGLWFASLGNTAAAAFWCIARVLDDRDLFEKLQIEILDVMQGRGIDALTKTDLSRCVTLDALIKETLRYYGSTQIYRSTMEDTTISIGNVEYALKKGSQVVYPSVVLHMNEDIYSDPAAFDYTRFLPDAVTGEPPSFVHKPSGRSVPHAWMPFGAGTTMCPGRFLATQEIMIVIIFFLTKIRATPVGVSRLPPAVHIFPSFPQPKEPYMMNICFRKAGGLMLPLLKSV